MKTTINGKQFEITIEKTFQGLYRLSTIKHSQLIWSDYMGYSKRDAIKLFKQKLST